ncbi:MAG: hypothetical protein GEU80_07680 [Dehalococcoidia bacterium]|nr:hypothetical protein [Dehalococcoidia bacterium]
MTSTPGGQPRRAPEHRAVPLPRTGPSPLVSIAAPRLLAAGLLIASVAAFAVMLLLTLGSRAAASGGFEIVVSDVETRANARALDGEHLSGPSYIFLTPGSGASRVRFYLDDPGRNGSPWQVENLGPHDFMGGDDDRGNPFDPWSVTPGAHTVTAAVHLPDNTVQVVHASFTAGPVQAPEASDGASPSATADTGQHSTSLPAQRVGDTYSLRVSTSDDRSGATDLHGASLSGLVYIFVGPDGGIKKVEFFVDNPQMSGKPYSTEGLPPFDLARTATSMRALPFDTSKLSTGEHAVTARVITKSGNTEVAQSAFTVGGAAGVPAATAMPTATPAAKTQASAAQLGEYYTLRVSGSGTRSGATALHGATLDGNAYIFMAPDTGISRVRFFLNDPQMKKAPFSKEGKQPYDFARTAGDGRAYPWNTSSVAAGEQVVTAEVTTSSGRREIVQAVFTTGGSVTAPVPASGSASTPTPTATPTATATPLALPSSAPAGAIIVAPGQDIQSVIKQHPVGSTFYLRAGVHRMQEIVPRDGDTFLGEPGAILNGSRLLTDFSRDGSYWVATGQKQQGLVKGGCVEQENGSRYDMCGQPEQLFIDDEPLWQVSSRSQVGPGKWYFDYGADKIYFADNPSGRTVEASVTMYAFKGSASDVSIIGLTVEKYSNPTQTGAIQGKDGSRWLVQGNLTRLNHGYGIRVGERMRALDNRVLRNGQIGMGGSGNDVLVQGNEIAYNNTGGFQSGWEAGGSKFVKTRNLVLRDNYVHHNYGPGLWTDIDNIDTLIEDNLLEHNRAPGIKHEISYAAVIRNNVSQYNGLGYDTWLWGAQIVIQNSPDVEIYGNKIIVPAEGADGIGLVSQDRGPGAYGPRVTKNAWVRDNEIIYLGSGGNSGLAGACGASDNNRFDRNTYRVPQQHLSDYQTYKRWELCGRASWDMLRAAGHERNGALIGQ